MFSYIWPIALVVLSNTLYHICSKSSPDKISPFATLTITYLIGAALSLVLYLITTGGGNLLKELPKMNWVPYVLGIVVVGLEAGWIYAYKAGWQVGTASTIQSSVLAVSLLIVGCLLFREGVTWNKIVGIAVCMIGLVFINLK